MWIEKNKLERESEEEGKSLWWILRKSYEWSESASRSKMILKDSPTAGQEF